MKFLVFITFIQEHFDHTLEAILSSAKIFRLSLPKMIKSIKISFYCQELWKCSNVPRLSHFKELQAQHDLCPFLVFQQLWQSGSYLIELFYLKNILGKTGAPLDSQMYSPQKTTAQE